MDCKPISSRYIENVSATVAEIVMGHIEETTLSTFPFDVKLWKRYFDDILACTKFTSTQMILDHLNSVNPAIQFTLEVESGGNFPFPDVHFSRLNNGKISTTVRRKKTHTDSYLRFESNHPARHKAVVVRTLLGRVSTHISDPNSKAKEDRHVVATLQACSYSLGFINRNRPTPSTSVTDDRLELRYYTPIPGLEFYIAMTSTRRTSRTTTCGTFLFTPRTSCLPSHGHMVHNVPCKDCNLSYIGETQRHLGDRLKENKDSGLSDRSRNLERMKRIADDEEELCALTDSCIVDNVTARSITVRWPCCTSKSFDLTSNTVGFARGYDDCECWGVPYRHNFVPLYLEKEKTLKTSDCSATFTDYCPYGDYEIVIKTQEESCSIQQSTLPEVPVWSQRKALAEDKILVSWTDGYCTEYKKPIYRISWMGPDLDETVEEQTETEMNISLLLPNTKYTINVQACDNHKHQNDRRFCSRNITTEITTKPGTPSQPLNVSATAVNSTAILLTWDKPEDPRGAIDGYEVVCHNGNRTVHRVFIEGYQLSYLVNKLHSWTRYVCTIQAFNTDPDTAQKLFSALSSADTITKPEAPTAPGRFLALNARYNDVVLLWHPPSEPRGPIDGYSIKVLTNDVVDGRASYHRLISLSPNTNYTITISAFNYDHNYSDDYGNRKRLDGEEIVWKHLTPPEDTTCWELLHNLTLTTEWLMDFVNETIQHQNEISERLAKVDSLLR